MRPQRLHSSLKEKLRLWQTRHFQSPSRFCLPFIFIYQQKLQGNFKWDNLQNTGLTSEGYKYLANYYLSPPIMITFSYRIGIICLLVVAGSLSIINLKFQNTHYVFQGPFYKQFFHPYLQTMVMFFAELLALPIFFLHKSRNPQRYRLRTEQAKMEGKKLKMNKLLLLIPCFFDLLSNTLIFLALNFVPASSYQILKGGGIITTLLFSVILLKQKVHNHHIAGCLSVFVGILIVGIVNSIYAQSEGSDGYGSEIMGYLLIVVALFTMGLFFTSEQKLMSIYHLEPLEVVGFQGLFGLIIYIFLAFVLSYTPCPFGPKACVYSEAGQPFFQYWPSYLNQLKESTFLLTFICLSICTTIIYNIAGISITKYINALARIIADMLKTVLIWSLGMVVTLGFGSEYPNLAFQKVESVVIVFQVIGFSFFVLGNLIYNEIILLPEGLREKKVSELLIKRKEQSLYDSD